MRIPWPILHDARLLCATCHHLLNQPVLVQLMRHDCLSAPKHSPRAVLSEQRTEPIANIQDQSAERHKNSDAKTNTTRRNYRVESSTRTEIVQFVPSKGSAHRATSNAGIYTPRLYRTWPIRIEGSTKYMTRTQIGVMSKGCSQSWPEKLCSTGPRLISKTKIKGHVIHLLKLRNLMKHQENALAWTSVIAECRSKHDHFCLRLRVTLYLDTFTLSCWKPPLWTLSVTPSIRLQA